MNRLKWVVWVPVLSVLALTSAFASNTPKVVCKRLLRSMDGNDEILTIEPNDDGLYQVVYYRKNSGFMADPKLANKETTVVLASGFKDCFFSEKDPRIFSCSQLDAQRKFSQIYINLIEETSADNYKKQTVKRRSFQVAVQSPMIEGGVFEDGYPHKSGTNKSLARFTFNVEKDENRYIVNQCTLE